MLGNMKFIHSYFRTSMYYSLFILFNTIYLKSGPWRVISQSPEPFAHVKNARKKTTVQCT